MHVVHDERVAAFVALGVGLDGTPAVLLCTSGTAAANFHPAVVEAGLSDVPMIVITADRPPELRDVGAPQAIDQTHLYGRSVRWFHDPGVPDAGDAAGVALARRPGRRRRGRPGRCTSTCRSASRSSATPGALPPRRRAAPSAAVHDGRRRRHAAALVDRAAPAAGSCSPAPARRRATVVAAFVAATGWPLLADAGVSAVATSPAPIAAADALLRHHGFAAERPEVVVRARPAGDVEGARPVGGRVAARPVVQVGGPGVIDPDHLVAGHARRRRAGRRSADAARAASGDPAWAARWSAAADRAEAAIDRALGPEAPLSEPAVARLVARHRPAGGARRRRRVDADARPRVVRRRRRRRPRQPGRQRDRRRRVDRPRRRRCVRAQPTVVVRRRHRVRPRRRRADRRCAAAAPTCASSSSTTTAAASSRSCPQATELPPERFEQLFGTPHGTDVVALAAAHGIDAATVTTAAELVARLRPPGPSVTRVRTDRAENVRVHAALNAAVAAALD